MDQPRIQVDMLGTIAAVCWTGAWLIDCCIIAPVHFSTLLSHNWRHVGPWPVVAGSVFIFALRLYLPCVAVGSLFGRTFVGVICGISAVVLCAATLYAGVLVGWS
ncbi:MAG: hypothetical protein K8T91_00585 [Planctomycetes bacterium]|nr:hypothetical protein [Planctomycetota bacterium]